MKVLGFAYIAEAELIVLKKRSKFGESKFDFISTKFM